jgi:hypothetical protein
MPGHYLIAPSLRNLNDLGKTPVREIQQEMQGQKETNNQVFSRTKGLERELAATKKKLAAHEADGSQLSQDNMKKLLEHKVLSEALLSGTAKFRIRQDRTQVPIAEPNGAGAGEFKTYFTVEIVTAQGKKIDIIDGMDLALTPGDTSTSAGPPTIEGTTVTLRRGSGRVGLIWDTDSKTYVATETVTCDVDVTLAGVALAQVVVTYTLIA